MGKRYFDNVCFAHDRDSSDYVIKGPQAVRVTAGALFYGKFFPVGIIDIHLSLPPVNVARPITVSESLVLVRRKSGVGDTWVETLGRAWPEE